MSTALTLANTGQTYGAVTKTFHWLTALLILALIPLGLIANAWPYDTSAALSTKATLFSIHKTLGVTVFFVALLRILWAASQPKPALLHPERRLETWAAETVHWLLYASLVIVPLSGWLHHAATSGFAPIWWPFGQTLPFVPVNDAVAGFFGAWHLVFTKVLAAAVALHIAGALKHHLLDRDATLRRMLPGRTAPDTALAAGHPRAPAAIAAGIWAAAIALGSWLGLSDGPASAIPAPATTQADPGGWTVEEGTLGIAVTQLGSVVEGQFQTWSAAIEFDPDAAPDDMGEVRVEIAVPSLTLGSITDQALGQEFFAADAHPTAVFEADIRTAPEGSDRAYVAEGTLTMKDAEAPVTLPFDLEIDGDTARMTGGTTLDRREWQIGTASYGDEQTVKFSVAVDVALTATRSE